MDSLILNAKDLLEKALQEDAPKGDLTVLSLDYPELKTSARIIAKQNLFFSGSEFIEAMEELSESLECELYFKNGDKILKGQSLVMISGLWSEILLFERSVLNLLGHLCGVATKTAAFVKETEGTHCKILDTRKTFPFLRTWDKRAVKHGGGMNHRMGLSDAVMIKENHWIRQNSIVESIQKIRNNTTAHITVEVETIDQLKMVLDTSADRILLDNMPNELLKEAVRITKNQKKLEASGNMTLERISSVSKTGVDFISVGALTHSAPQADLSLLISN